MSYFYNSRTETYEPIPDTPAYVLANDNFMSGWGGAREKTNTIVVPCENFDQAENVADWIRRNRDEMKYVRVVANKPRSKSHILYSLIPEWATDHGKR